MQAFFSGSLDYIFFFYGLGFILLAVVSSVLGKEDETKLDWKTLGLFGVTHGVNEWLDLLAFSLGDNLYFHLLRGAVMAVSFVFLYEFGRRSALGLGAKAPPAWALPALVLLSLGGLAWGPAGFNAATRYALAFTGALLASRAVLLAAAGARPEVRHHLVCFGWLLAAYAVAAGLVTPAAGLPPAGWLNSETFMAVFSFPVQLLRGALACCMAVCAWLYYVDGASHTYSWSRRRLGRRLAAGLLAVLIGGLALTEFWGLLVDREVTKDSDNLHAIMRNRLEDALFTAENSALSMSGSPWLIGALASGTPEAVRLGTSVLQRYCSAYGFTVCYLMDMKGTVRASSNYRDPDSLVGHNYSFRPYFLDAKAGRPGTLFALGVTTGRRGFYASVPVMEGSRQVGVAAIKQELEFLSKELNLFKYFFLVSPEGVIFMSSVPEYVFRALWPVPAPLREKLRGSRQFGALDFVPLLEAQPADRSHLDFSGAGYHLSRTPLKWEGWTLVGFASTAPLRHARLGGIAISLLLCLLLIDFFQRLIRAEMEKETAEKLFSLRDEVRTLRGIVPICASCKKIRDDKGFWSRVETYVSAHTEAKFSHGLCPDCERKLYPEFAEDLEKERGRKPPET